MILNGLKSIIRGLEIAVSDFVSARETASSIEKQDVKVRMDAHLEAQ